MNSIKNGSLTQHSEGKNCFTFKQTVFHKSINNTFVPNKQTTSMFTRWQYRL